MGYVHIPDMGPHGYAEFHRLYLAEVERDALVVDVRYNGGGHVSSLLLEKLARRRIAYAVARWAPPSPYPEESPAGPLVAITNEQAGSDGDIFTHSFKLLGLGPVVGKRTWGGVIGISPTHPLVDGSLTTQPEYSFWFSDVGWAVENYGTDPDHDVDIKPQDYAAGRDPQLDKALDLVTRALQAGTGPWVPTPRPGPTSRSRSCRPGRSRPTATAGGGPRRRPAGRRGGAGPDGVLTLGYKCSGLSYAPGSVGGGARGPPLRLEPRAAGGGHPPRRAAAHPGRGGVGQDPGAHPPSRLADL